MSKPSATDRRCDAIRATSDRFTDWANRAEAGAATEEESAEVIGAIRELTALGRTDRWKNAVEAWVSLILETPEAPRWALIQGSIFTAHQA